MKDNGKQYIVIRSDLPAGAQATQACHVAFAFGLAFTDSVREWNAGSNNLVLLHVPDEAWLDALAQRCEAAGVAVSRFHEPDFGEALTAIALGAGAKRLVSSLPLALRAA
jgi:peptidyl-tRNA hydrolase